MPGAGARARQKAKREAYLKNRPYPGFTCRGCKHEDMMHTNWFGKCIVKECDCSHMDEIKGEQKSQSEHLSDAIQTTVFAYEGE